MFILQRFREHRDVYLMVTGTNVTDVKVTGTNVEN